MVFTKQNIFVRFLYVKHSSCVLYDFLVSYGIDACIKQVSKDESWYVLFRIISVVLGNEFRRISFSEIVNVFSRRSCENPFWIRLARVCGFIFSGPKNYPTFVAVAIPEIPLEKQKVALRNLNYLSFSFYTKIFSTEPLNPQTEVLKHLYFLCNAFFFC
jgi:hypothetical protein